MKTKLLVLISVILMALTVGVYAIITLWSGNVAVDVTSPDIGVYWDESCTEPVSTINFGSCNKGSTASQTLYIKNKGSTSVTLSYTSTLSSVSGVYIVDMWTYNGSSLNGVSLAPGQVISTTYTIEISSTCPAQTFNWVISLEA